MKRLLLVVLILCLIAAGTTVAAIAVGRQEPTLVEAKALHLTDCLPPCWIGIVPGKTTIGEAKKRIIATFQQSSDFDYSVDYGATSNEVIANLKSKASGFIVEVDIGSNDEAGDQSIVNAIEFPFSDVRSETPFQLAPSLADIHLLMGPPANLLILSSFRDRALQYGDEKIGVLVIGGTEAWDNKVTDLMFYDYTKSSRTLSAVITYPWFGLTTSDSHYLRQCDTSADVLCSSELPRHAPRSRAYNGG